MEVKYPVFRTWKFFLLGCVFGGLLYILFSDKIQQDTSLFDAENAIVAHVPPLVEVSYPTTTEKKPMVDTENAMVQLAPPSVEASYPITSETETKVDAENAMVRLATPPLVEVLYPITSETKPSNNPSNVSTVNPVLETNVNYIGTENRTKIIVKEECNMYEGRWVYKEDEKAAYNALTCPLLETPVICQENGRSDLDYVKWRWEARDCDIPLFDGKDMLQRLRNKRVIIVGDSLNRNMWESLACLIYTSIPSLRTILDIKKGPYKSLKVKDYNFTVEFYMSPFLVELSLHHKSGHKVLILDKISSFSKQWKGADVMVFNSGHWWTHNNDLKAWDIFQYKEELIEDMPRQLAFKRAMRTWASWIKKNVDTKKTHVYFRSVSPSHNRRKSDQWCYNVTKPMMLGESYVNGFPKNLDDVVENLMKGMSKLNVKYLQITKISQYRNDAHPSIFTTDLKTLDKNEYDNLSRKADCNHWCLPGLPDTWNRLLYASIFYDNLFS